MGNSNDHVIMFVIMTVKNTHLALYFMLLCRHAIFTKSPWQDNFSFHVDIIVKISSHNSDNRSTWRENLSRQVDKSMALRCFRTRQQVDLQN